MATVHVGANADPHRASLWPAPPEGWLVPAERRRASTTPLRAHSSRGMTTRGGHSHPRQNDESVARPAPRVPGSLTAPKCPVGARLASRSRTQIIRSVAAPERRFDDRRRDGSVDECGRTRPGDVSAVERVVWMRALDPRYRHARRGDRHAFAARSRLARNLATADSRRSVGR
jgi:hypothetical protein